MEEFPELLLLMIDTERAMEDRRSSFTDRRTGNDRRRAYKLGLLMRGEAERRGGTERRSGKERRGGWVKIGRWCSVRLDKLKIAKFLMK
jgi:hypothetical protein